MTDEHTEALIKYRIERAEETYNEALLMQTGEHWNACANRLYYACFYAVSALLVKYGFSSSKHAGIKSLFNQHIIKKKVLEKSQGRLYNQLFEARQEGDYVDFVSFDRDLIEPWMQKVKAFIDDIKHLCVD
ncbi:MAG: HEPN domain-containing protein [Desulfobacterales bacterium]|jgi:uncharacterized protein (UPF0332 family)